jgi:hypothetical protein
MKLLAIAKKALRSFRKLSRRSMTSLEENADISNYLKPKEGKAAPTDQENSMQRLPLPILLLKWRSMRVSEETCSGP